MEKDGRVERRRSGNYQCYGVKVPLGSKGGAPSVTTSFVNSGVYGVRGLASHFIIHGQDEGAPRPVTREGLCVFRGGRVSFECGG